MRHKIGVIRTTTASQNDHCVDFTSMILRTANIGGYCELQIEEGLICDGTTFRCSDMAYMVLEVRQWRY